MNVWEKCLWEKQCPHRTYYKLHNDLVQMEDYLTCLMTSLIGRETKDLEHYMDQNGLNAFNQAIDGIYSELAGRCWRWNCLNATDIAPSERSTQCVLASPSPVHACRKRKPFDKHALIACTFTDPSGGQWEGVCDPNGHW